MTEQERMAENMLSDAAEYFRTRQENVDRHARRMHETGRDVDFRNWHAKRKAECTEALMYARKVYWSAKGR